MHGKFMKLYKAMGDDGNAVLEATVKFNRAFGNVSLNQTREIPSI